MKLKNKINAFVFTTLSLLGISILLIGYFMMSQIIGDFYNNQFSRELNNINQEVIKAYQIIEEAGVLEIEDYVLAEQNDLLSKLKRYTFGTSGFISVINNKGKILLGPESNHINLPSQTYLQKASLSNETEISSTNQLTYPTDNGKYFSVYAKTSVWDWIVIININENEMYDLRDKYLIYVSLISLLIFMLVFWISIRSTNIFRSQIDLILNYLKRMGAGSHSLRIPITKKNDLYEISLEINDMIEQVENEIEQRKLTEKSLLLAKEEADKANQAKSEFLSRMSHELRTPMNAILGFTQLLSLDPQNPLTKSQKDNLNEVSTAGKHLLNLINEVLDLSKIEAGHVELLIEKVHLGNALKESFQLVKPLADTRGITIQLYENNTLIPSIDHDSFNLAVVSDFSRLKQVLINILNNAVKYNRDNGVIVLRCIKKPDNILQISISDEGNGLSSEQQVQIFEAFNRLGMENSNIEGTGVGLVICKYLVELMGGKIGLESTVGKGCTFTLELPYDPHLIFK